MTSGRNDKLEIRKSSSDLQVGMKLLKCPLLLAQGWSIYKDFLYNQGGAKFLWLARHMPEQYLEAVRFLLLHANPSGGLYGL